MNTPAKLKKSAKKMCNVCEKKIAGNAPEFDPVDPIFLLENCPSYHIFSSDKLAKRGYSIDKLVSQILFICFWAVAVLR